MNLKLKEILRGNVVNKAHTINAGVGEFRGTSSFTDPKAFVSVMQGYMQDAKFSRGKKDLPAFASLVFVGNIEYQRYTGNSAVGHRRGNLTSLGQQRLQAGPDLPPRGARPALRCRAVR